MKNVYQIGSGDLTFDIIERIINENLKLELAPEAKDRIQKCRDYLDKKIKESDVPLYGITTGFGSLCNRNISSDELSTLQENLVKSHACSVGAEMPHVIVKLMFLLKAHALSLGHSGVQVITVQRIIDFFNNDVMPIVYDRGSLGASGDLAPLANLFLPLIGVGDVYYKGKRCEAISVLDEFGWEPVKLKSKEGLALLNGTQFMSANGVYVILKAFRLSKKADLIAAISLEAFDGRIDPFMDCIQQMRPHKGQIETGAAFRRILEGSEIIAQPKQHVQDPYSFRCIPQVHGATKDAINHVASVLLTEINSVTDNPTIFPDEDLIISGGNFHGQPLALVYDYLAIAMAELGNISERRVAQLIMGLRGLPEFLVANPGLNSGFMIPQYAAASMVSQNKMYCYLTKEGYQVTTANDGEEGLDKFNQVKPDMVLLDVMMPKMDGLEVCRRIRKLGNTPVMMLTAKGETFDKVLGLELGADDYMVKPFDTKEVVARIKAVLRRCTTTTAQTESTEGVIEFDNLRLDMNSYELRVKGKVVEAPPKELELLNCLASHPNRVYTRDQLLDEVWGFEYYGDSRTIDVHVKRLREKLAGASDKWELKTVWGVGYKFEVRQ